MFIRATTAVHTCISFSSSTEHLLVTYCNSINMINGYHGNASPLKVNLSIWLFILFQSKKALAIAKEDYDRQNDALMEDMPRLYEGRTDYFQPSFQALIKSQVM